MLGHFARHRVLEVKKRKICQRPNYIYRELFTPSCVQCRFYLFVLFLFYVRWKAIWKEGTARQSGKVSM